MCGKQVIFKSGETFETKKLGGKGRNLAILADRGLPTPEWLAISPAAFYMSLSANSLESWPQLGMKDRAVLASTVLPSARLMAELRATIDFNGWTDELFAVRSSSREEDGAELSFAGQLESVLNVPVSQLAEAIARVWRSAFTPGIDLYRNINGISAPALAPAVIIQRMLAPSAAGVAFGADPVSGDRNVVVISAVSGLADKLVSGEVDSATFTVAGRIITKSHKSDLANMTKEEVLQVVELVEKAGNIFGGPQDVEWAFQEGKLLILQSRPVTGLENFAAPPAEPKLVSIQILEEPLNAKSYLEPVAKVGGTKTACEDNRLDLWDNSNIGESYPGVTTPLTFSFARAAYERVYIDFSRLMGVNSKTIEANSYIYPQMLGLIRGRIYYNLINWYRLLALFPGFKMNRKFMEQMMGVKCELPEEFLKEFNSSASFGEKASDVIALAQSVPNLLYKWNKLPRTISDFNQRVEKSFELVPTDFESLSTSQLYQLYRKLEKELLEKWDAPIVNDFFAMIAYGVLKGLCEKWIQEPGIHNQLLCDETGIISTEPAKLQQRLAEIASTDAVLIEALRTCTGTTLESHIARNPAFSKLIACTWTSLPTDASVS
jgi:Phosphoenolpyruvate synthase/pyruvate phosphate dikinase